jgi:hypothetical protein
MKNKKKPLKNSPAKKKDERVSKNEKKVRVISEKKEVVKYKDLTPVNLERALVSATKNQVTLSQARVIEDDVPIISLEQNVEPAPRNISKSKEDFSYIGTNEQGEMKYLSENSPVGPKRVDVENLGRGKEQVREAQFIHSEAQVAQTGVETYTIPERIDAENLGKEREKTREAQLVSSIDYEPAH